MANDSKSGSHALELRRARYNAQVTSVFPLPLMGNNVMRRNRGRVATTLYLTAALWLMLVPAANAYIDGQTTTIVFQAIVAGIAAGGMFFKLYWRKVTAFFRRDNDDEASPAVTADASGATDQ
jgi:hypothetical protein